MCQLRVLINQSGYINNWSLKLPSSAYKYSTMINISFNMVFPHLKVKKLASSLIFIVTSHLLACNWRWNDVDNCQTPPLWYEGEGHVTSSHWYCGRCSGGHLWEVFTRLRLFCRKVQRKKRFGTNWVFFLGPLRPMAKQKWWVCRDVLEKAADKVSTKWGKSKWNIHFLIVRNEDLIIMREIFWDQKSLWENW